VAIWPYPHPVDLGFAEALIAQEIAHAAAIKRRWEYYLGQHPRQLKVRQGQPDDNVTVNLCRAIVDKGVSFLFGQDVSFELVEGERTEAEEWLDACWAANRKLTLLQKLALSGAVAGHAFLKIVLEPGRAYPRLVVLDPATVVVTVAPDDHERVLSYRIQFPTIDQETGRPVVLRQTIVADGTRWVIRDEKAFSGDRWQTVAETVWPYEFAPVIDCQNLPNPHDYWGVSDLEEDVLRLNDAINFLLSNLVRIVRYHAHPKTWGRGFRAEQLDISVDETIVLPSPDAELRNLEMQSDLGSSIQLYLRLREAFHEIARVPEIATGRVEGVGSLSGVALQILYQPLVEKTETKRRLYGDLLVETNRRLLAIGGFGDDLMTALHWPELIPGDPEAEAKTLVLWQQLGVSQDTILRRLGLDPEIEREKRETSAGEATMRAIDTLLGEE
jgi:hypothetical protein